MAIIETNTESSLHLRSNSLPFTPHPIVSQLEEILQRLKSCEATSSASSSSSLCNKLNDMQDLHDCTDNLLQLPIEQDLAQNCNEKLVDDLLEGSLRLLDICSEAKDYLLLSKESMHELQSVIRRRGNETGFTDEGVKFLALRKKMKKQIQKVLRNLKAMKNELIASSSNKDNNTSAMFGFLKEAEAEAVTLSSLEHLLLFISDSKRNSKQSRWSAISKLMQPQRPVCDSQNEFEVDADLQALINGKLSSTENFQSHMEDLEMCIQDLEIGVEHLSRKLIRNRVSLLNIFNH